MRVKIGDIERIVNPENLQDIIDWVGDSHVSLITLILRFKAKDKRLLRAEKLLGEVMELLSDLEESK